MNKRIIYISGPYRDSGINGIFENILRARHIARELWKKGWVAICPHLNTMLMDGKDISDRTFLDGDLEIISRVDAVVMIEGWEGSQGSQEEHQFAIELGMSNIYYGITEVPDIRE